MAFASLLIQAKIRIAIGLIGPPRIGIWKLLPGFFPRFLQRPAKGLAGEKFLVKHFRKTQCRIVLNGPSSRDDRAHTLPDQFTRETGGHLIVGHPADLPEIAAVKEHQFRDRIQHRNLCGGEKQAIVKDHAGLCPCRLDMSLVVIPMAGNMDDSIGLGHKLVQHIDGAEPLS